MKLLLFYSAYSKIPFEADPEKLVLIKLVFYNPFEETFKGFVGVMHGGKMHRLKEFDTKPYTWYEYKLETKMSEIAKWFGIEIPRDFVLDWVVGFDDNISDTLRRKTLIVKKPFPWWIIPASFGVIIGLGILAELKGG